MRDLAVLLLHLLTTIVRLTGFGGAHSVVAESVLVKHQLMILNCSRRRSPKLHLADRMSPACGRYSSARAGCDTRHRSGSGQDVDS